MSLLKNKVFLITSALIIAQVIVISGFELSYDEAYYWMYSKFPAWGYFDHPPMVAMFIYLFSFFGESEFFIRLPFLLSHILTLFVVWSLFEKKDRMIATLIFISIPLASLAGLAATPDMPQLFGSAIYLLALKDYLEVGSARSKALLTLSLIFLAYSKYNSIVLPFFTLVALPKLLLRKEMWLIGFFVLAGLVPHILWMQETNWQTVTYHFEERPQTDGFEWAEVILTFLALTVFINGPFGFPILAKLSIWKQTTDFDRILKTIAFGNIFFIVLIAVKSPVGLNWVMPGTIPIIYFMVKGINWNNKFYQWILGVMVVIVFFIRFAPLLPLTPEDFEKYGEIKGWKEFSQEVKNICGSDHHLYANKYQWSSKLSYYLGEMVNSTSFASRKSQFDIWAQQDTIEKIWKKEGTKSDEVCLLTDKEYLDGKVVMTPGNQEAKILKISREKLESLRGK